MPRACWTSKNNKLRTYVVGLRWDEWKRVKKNKSKSFFLHNKKEHIEEVKVGIWKWILSNPLQLCVTAFAFDINIGISILIFLFNFQCWAFFFLMFYSIAGVEWIKVCSISMNGLVTCLTANEKKIEWIYWKRFWDIFFSLSFTPVFHPLFFTSLIYMLLYEFQLNLEYKREHSRNLVEYFQMSS